MANAYRSRIAETYANSLGLKDFEFTSSGIAAHLFEQRMIGHTEYVAKAHGLEKYLKKKQTQTSSKLLNEQDVIIFMHPNILDEALKEYDVDLRRVYTWHIEDVWPGQLEKLHKTLEESAEAAFKKIKNNTDKLVKELTCSSWIDIVDENNKELGFRANIDMANRRNLWHRSVHALIQTADGRYVIEKRSNNIIFAAGLLDVSLGGAVDTGETPEQTLRREIKEELGIDIEASQAKLLRVDKSSHYHPKYKRHTRGFSYEYFVKLKPGQENFKPQAEEVARIMLANKRQVKSLVTRHYLKSFGRLNYPYKLYKTDIELAEKL